MTDVPSSPRRADDMADRLARLRERRSTGVGSRHRPTNPTTAPRRAPISSVGAFDPPVPNTIAGPPSVPAPGWEASATPSEPPPSRPSASTRRRPTRRSPARAAKVVTVGASTSAVLAMIAGYGIADRADGTQPTLGNDDGTMPTVSPVVGPPTAPSPPNAVASTIPSTEPPRVIVVYVDARTGQPIPDPLSPVGPVEQDVAASTSVDAHPGDRTAATGGPVTDAAIATDGAAAGHATTPAEVEQPATADPVPVEAPTAVDLAVPAPPPPTVVNQAPAPASAPAPAPAPEPSGESGGS